jgi:hypothetical protein
VTHHPPDRVPLEQIRVVFKRAHQTRRRLLHAQRQIKARRAFGYVLSILFCRFRVQRQHRKTG